MKPFFVYMLRCNDDSYYVGHTDDLERRLGHRPPCRVDADRPCAALRAQQIADSLVLDQERRGGAPLVLGLVRDATGSFSASLWLIVGIEGCLFVSSLWLTHERLQAHAVVEQPVVS